MTGIDYIIVAVFIGLLALAGLTLSRFIREPDDLFVAGRELTPFVLCTTIAATNISMFAFVGMGGTAYQSGVSIIWQNWTGCMALVMSGIMVVPLMRRLRVRSVPEFLDLRYGKFLRILIGAFWGLRLCFYLGILLYLAATASVVITGYQNYYVWLLIFAVLSIFYSAIGGAWAVAIMDSAQFLVLLAGALIILPVAMHFAGGLPALAAWLKASDKGDHLLFVPTHGEYNWSFVLAIQLLSFKFATVDQAILQRAFGARTPRIGAKGMVLAGIITTPLAFFWILPGLAVTRLQPGLETDHALPWLLSHELPRVGRGLLGFVLCGLVAAQVSPLTADINSVATLFTSDVFRRLRRAEPTRRQLLFVMRLSSLICGAIMLVIAGLLHHSHGGAVRANLVLVGLFDMPLFVITVIYGLLWRRTNAAGATAGFFAGGLAASFTHLIVRPDYFHHYIEPAARSVSGLLASALLNWHLHVSRFEPYLRNIPPIVGTLAALVVTPIVTLLTAPPPASATKTIRGFFHAAPEDGDDADNFRFIPSSLIGRAGLAMLVCGFTCYLAGVLSASREFALAGTMAIGGMIVVLLGGLIRVYAD